ncbi:MAG: DUF4956 domain-containing protein [Hymenobacteraceae bacterium]|nr:DUF4956 domain-containing protein [Hymenobacteraceae bacterium]MDX5397408.1 DUF4956 domain-containing protein [Hymenobacteraceae bacterium]MDX5444110.1 DUF4956 domain-containing protein [Hymenobacteraceae bacterium]MDX5513486.1 DUF4956 domain-containing protein [Hymenobacteraceae bacterium]
MEELSFLQNIGNQTISHQQFFVNLLITAVVSALIAVFYIRFGQSISNRRKYANNFLLLSLTTMLIIYIVKTSVALSLGLVGALSIIRFRTAIKEPEELGYLFLNIGVGLAMGANQVLLTIIAVPIILGLMLIQALRNKRTAFNNSEHLFFNVSCPADLMQPVHHILQQHFKSFLLKRMDKQPNGLTLSYQIETDDMQKLLQVQKELNTLSADIEFSFVEQRNLVF